MKTKVKKDLFEKSIEELKIQLNENKKELFLIKLEHFRKKLKNTRHIFSKKKEIATILTFIRRKELKHENV